MFPVQKDEASVPATDGGPPNVTPEATGFYVLYGQWDQISLPSGIQQVEQNQIDTTSDMENNHPGDLVLTYLEDFKRDPNTAKPFFILRPHLEYKIPKGVVLLEAQFLPFLSKLQATMLLRQCVDYYLDSEKYHHVATFNLDSEKFSFYDAFPTLLI